jgi:hypothetical protein
MKTFVLGKSANGEAEFFIADVAVSDDEYALGMHYDRAIEQAREAGFEQPFIAFDEKDQAAKQMASFGSPVPRHTSDERIEKDYPTRIDLCDGKYTVIFDLNSGQAEALRYGEKWRSLSGDKMVLAMFDTIVALRNEVEQLKVDSGKQALAVKFVDQVARLQKWSTDEEESSECDEPSEGAWDSHDTLMGLITEARQLVDSPTPTPIVSYHLLVIEGDVDPGLIGPLESAEAVFAEAKAHRAGDPEGNDGIYHLVISDGVPNVFSFCGGDLDPDELQSFVVSFEENDPESFPRFENHYCCPSCGNEWSMKWDSMCDDECGACGAKNISPQHSDSLEVTVFTFECMAEDVAHAIEQAENAHPGATILGAVQVRIHQLNVGDEVYWNDPADGLSSGYYSIRKINTDSGRIESQETILLLANEAGSQAEVFAHEIN